MTEADLESIILTEGTSKLGVDARYILGKNYIEGSFPEKVPRNEKKGISWIREAVSQDHIAALEFKTYYDIRFEKHPSIEKILKSLEKVVEKSNSSRACASLAEFCHAK
jgi:TPR repeat protein